VKQEQTWYRIDKLQMFENMLSESLASIVPLISIMVAVYFAFVMIMPK